MQYNWLKDRERLKQFIIYWAKGANNFADYFTKHFPSSYHQQIRSTYLLNLLKIIKNIQHAVPVQKIKTVQRACSPSVRGCVDDVRTTSQKNKLDYTGN